MRKEMSGKMDDKKEEKNLIENFINGYAGQEIKILSFSGQLNITANQEFIRTRYNSDSNWRMNEGNDAIFIKDPSGEIWREYPLNYTQGEGA